METIKLPNNNRNLISSVASPASPAPVTLGSPSRPRKLFSIEEVVNRHLSIPYAVQEIEIMGEKVIKELMSFTTKTPTMQLTSFGPTGMVILDLLNRSNLLNSVPVVFIDTLYHFDETYALIERVKRRFPKMNLRVYKPKGCNTRVEFEAKYGENLWQYTPSKFAYYTKAEPRDRAMNELRVSSYINGRRKSQGNRREELKLIEVDQELSITRMQPLFEWSFEQVWSYIKLHNVPYNSLHDQGFKSIGDFVTTCPVSDEEDERSGRWKGSNQTECGLHMSPSQISQLS